MLPTLAMCAAAPPGYPQARILDCMSFGAAAHSRRILADDADCPCGGGVFGVCCAPILDGQSARTAVQLMRSRFTAFALVDERHLRASWHPLTAPDERGLDLDPQLRWERLEIVRAEAGAEGDRGGTVEFRAHWHDRSTGERGALHEVSRFRFAAGRWFYLDGDVDR